MADAIVIGGGFFGAGVAHYLATRRGLAKVTLVEREAGLMARSSFVNQARVHGGYHYPRSFTTAYRSRVSMPRFCAEFPDAVFDRFACLYGVARKQSKVTVRQMERFCAAIGAPLEEAPEDLARLFDSRLIERAWLVEERAFNADRLRAIMEARLGQAGVELRLNSHVDEIAGDVTRARVRVSRGDTRDELSADFVFNCTYSNLQRLAGPNAPDFRLRHEIAEVVLVTPPPELAEVGITVMDGPFFSLFPFPARGAHSLTHVRYTPHEAWLEDGATVPVERLAAHPRQSGFDWMQRDAARYVPAIAHCNPVSTMFEVKTVLQRSEGNDSRPILFERHGPGGRMISILGGKFDNIYDAFERLDEEDLSVGVLAA